MAGFQTFNWSMTRAVLRAWRRIIGRWKDLKKFFAFPAISEMIQSTTEKSSGKSRRWVRFPNLTEADKARIVSLKVAKWNHDKIAMSVGCSVSTVYRVLKKWNKAKRHYVYLKVGCPLVFTEQIKARIVEKMNEKGGRKKSPAQLIAELQGEFPGFQCGCSSMRRHLVKLGFFGCVCVKSPCSVLSTK